jgi:hypothetical protein
VTPDDDFDHPELLSRVVDIETPDGTRRGISLGSIWTVDGVVREDNVVHWIAEVARAAGWPVQVVDRVGDREWWAALEPTVRITLSHLGEGDRTDLGSCPPRLARAVVDALNGAGDLPDDPAAQDVAAAYQRANAAWRDEGTPWCSAEVAVPPE